jgi:hypothetical protein
VSEQGLTDGQLSARAGVEVLPKMVMVAGRDGTMWHRVGGLWVPYAEQP